MTSYAALALQNAARASRNAAAQPKPQQPENQPVPEQTEKPDTSILQSAGNTALSGISAVGNALDLPGSVVRDVITWLPGGTKPQNPVDQLLDPFGARAHENRVEGRQLLRDYGLAGKRDTWGNFAAGLALEAGTDPLTYFGVGAFSRAGKALSKAGLTRNLSNTAKEMAMLKGKDATKIGSWGGGVKMHARRLLDHVKDMRDHAITKVVTPSAKGTRLKGKNTFSSIDDLPQPTKENQWTVVDDGQKYSVFETQDLGDGKIGWAENKPLSLQLQGAVNTHSIKMTADRARNLYRQEMQRAYRTDGVKELDQPIRSVVSFQVPFADSTRRESFIKDQDAFDRWINRQNDATPINKRLDDIGPDSPGPESTPQPGPVAPSPAGPNQTAPQPTATSALVQFSDNAAHNAEMNRLYNEAQEIVGEDASSDWMETIKARASAMTPGQAERMLKQLSVKRGSMEEQIDAAARIVGGDTDVLDQADAMLKQGVPEVAVAGADEVQTPAALKEWREKGTSSSFFKRWFGDWEKDPSTASKVVDENGKPLVVYHGTGQADLGVDDAAKHNRQLAKRTKEYNEWQEKYSSKRKGLFDELKKATKSSEEAMSQLGESITGDKYSGESLAQLAGQQDTVDGIMKSLLNMSRWMQDAITRDMAEEMLEKSRPHKEAVREIRRQIEEIPRPVTRPSGRMRSESPEFQTMRFGSNDTGYMSAGSYFTSSADMASDYARFGIGDKKGVIPVYLDLKNPYIHGVTKDERLEGLVQKKKAEMDSVSRAARADVDEFSRNLAVARRESLIELGYDGEVYNRKTASEAGIEIPGLGESEYVAFYPNQIKSATANSGEFSKESNSILKQGVDETKGFIDIARKGGKPIKAAITLLKGSDVSTLHHETAHAFRAYLQKPLLKKAESALEPLLKEPERLKAIRSSMPKDWDPSTAKLKDAEGNWTREAEEVWARAYERYLVDGSAPTSALKEAFERIKQMMLSVYRIVSGNPEEANKLLGGPVSPEMRAVFDEMLGKQKARKAPGAAKAVNQVPLGALPTTPKIDHKARIEKEIQSVPRVNPAATMAAIAGIARAASQPTQDLLASLSFRNVEQAEINRLASDVPEAAGRRVNALTVAGPDGTTVYLSPRATAKDLAHELGHVYLRNLADKNAAKIEGAISLAGIAPRTPDGTWTRESHEYIAEAFEDYLQLKQKPKPQQFMKWLGDKLQELTTTTKPKSPATKKAIDSTMNASDEALDTVSRRTATDAADNPGITPQTTEAVANKTPAEVTGDLPSNTPQIARAVDDTAPSDGLDTVSKPVAQPESPATQPPVKPQVAEEVVVKDKGKFTEAATGQPAKKTQIQDYTDLPTSVRQAIDDKVLPELFDGADPVETLRKHTAHLVSKPDAIEKLHSFLGRVHEPYARAISATSDSSQANKGIDLTRIIQDPSFEKISPNEILKDIDLSPFTGPQAKRIPAEIEQQAFRKYNYLKQLAANGDEASLEEALRLRNDLASAYISNAEAASRNLDASFAGSVGDDAMGDILLKSIEGIDQFDYTQGNRFSTFLHGNAYRSLKRDLVRAQNRSASAASEELLEATAERATDKLREIGVSEDKWAEATQTLSEQEMQVLGMKLAGKKNKEISEAVGFGETKVKQIQRQYQEKIRQQVEKFASSSPEPSAIKLLYEQKADQYKSLLKDIKDTDVRTSVANMLDAGEHLFYNNPAVRWLGKHFDRRTYGTYEGEAQEIARQAADAVDKAIFDHREILAGITRLAAKTQLLDEAPIVSNHIKNGIERSAARRLAQQELNERHSDIIRFLEQKEYKPLTAALYGKSANLDDLESQLTIIKEIFPERLVAQHSAGIASSKLQDDFIEYFPRALQKPNRISRQQARGNVILDSSLDSQKKRRVYSRNLPGGRPILEKLSIDPEISGQYYRQALIGKTLGKDEIHALTDKVLSNDEYRNGILKPSHFDKDGNVTKEGRKKASQVVAAIASLDPWYADNQVPLFGRNFLHDVSQYLQDSIAREGMARASQQLVANNLVTSGSEYTLSKLFNEIKTDFNQAYKNVINLAGRSNEYKAFRDAEIASIKQRLEDGEAIRFGASGKGSDGVLNLTPEGKLRVISKEEVIDLDDIKEGAQQLDEVETLRELTDDELEESLVLARSFADTFGLAVNKETYEAATFYLKPWSQPKEIGELRSFMMSALNLFKAHVTIPHLAFHVRNFTSGQAQNYFYGAYDPTAPIHLKYLRPIKQAFELRSGKTIKGISNQVPAEIRDEAMQRYGGRDADEAVSMWVQDEVFRFGLTGDKQGYAAERIGDAVSSAASQMPGAIPREQSLRTLGGLISRPPADTTLRDRLNFLHTRGSGRPEIVTNPNTGKQELGWKKYDDTTAFLMAEGEDLAMVTEELNRVAPFLAFIKQGYSVEEAAARVQKIQIDYSTLSETEKQIRQFIPFYTFSSRVLPLTAKDLIQNPGGKQAWAIRATNRAQDDETPAPDYIERSANIPLGETESGGRRYLTGLGLAFEDPLQFAGALHGDWKGALGEVVSRSRPELQAAAEIASGRSLFFDRPLGDLDPPLGRLRENLTPGESEGLAEPFISDGVEFLAAKSPASRYIATLNKLLDNRKDPLSRIANVATGFKVTDVEPEAQDRINIDRAGQILKEAYGAREGGYTYVPDWQQSRLSIDEQEKVSALQKLISDTQRISRQRKQQAEALAASATRGSEP